jgi:membrane-bound acyltransferase YfiQ involved in biofilm formation
MANTQIMQIHVKKICKIPVLLFLLEHLLQAFNGVDVPEYTTHRHNKITVLWFLIFVHIAYIVSRRNNFLYDSKPAQYLLEVMK